jgi:hypothetical protein
MKNITVKGCDKTGAHLLVSLMKTYIKLKYPTGDNVIEIKTDEKKFSTMTVHSDSVLEFKAQFFEQKDATLIEFNVETINGQYFVPSKTLTLAEIKNEVLISLGLN